MKCLIALCCAFLSISVLQGKEEIKKFSTALRDINPEKKLVSKAKKEVVDYHGAVVIAHDNFASIIGDAPLAVVDFYASWCGPCMHAKPIFVEVAKKLSAKCVFGVANVDDNRLLATQFGVETVPTFIFFKKGKEVARVTGAFFDSPAELEEALPTYWNK